MKDLIKNVYLGMFRRKPDDPYLESEVKWSSILQERPQLLKEVESLKREFLRERIFIQPQREDSRNIIRLEQVERELVFKYRMELCRLKYENEQARKKDDQRASTEAD